MKAILIEASHLVVGPGQLPDAAVVVEGNRIVAVGEASASEALARGGDVYIRERHRHAGAGERSSARAGPQSDPARLL